MATKRYDAILDAALKAFSDNGFEGTGLREIARIAQVAQPTINYHFKSKDKLFEAIVERGASRSTRLRIERLDTLLEKPGSVQLEDIVRVLFEIYNMPPEEISQEEQDFNKFIAKFGYGDSDYTRKIVLAAFDDLADNFIAAIEKTDEGFDRASATWAYLNALPTGIYAIDHVRRFPGLAGVSADDPRCDFSFDALIKFVCAGMRSLTKLS